jgi:hypothetical protein
LPRLRMWPRMVDLLFTGRGTVALSATDSETRRRNESTEVLAEWHRSGAFNRFCGQDPLLLGVWDADRGSAGCASE